MFRAQNLMKCLFVLFLLSSINFTPAQAQNIYCVTGLSNQPPDNFLVLRNQPSRSSKWSQTITFKNGDRVEVLGTEGDFYKVRAGNGEMGYSGKAFILPCETKNMPQSVQAAPQPQPAPQNLVNSQTNAAITSKLPLPMDEKGNYAEGEFYKQITCGVYRSDDDDLKAFSRKVEISKDKSGLIKISVQSKYGSKTINLLQDKKDEFPNCINDVMCRRLDTKYGRYLADMVNLAPVEIVVKQSVFCGRQLDQFIYYTINEKNFNITKLKGEVPEKFGFDFDLINMKDPEVQKIFPEYEFYGYFYQSKNGVSNLSLYVEGNEEFGPVALSSFININNVTSNNKEISDLDIYFNISGKLKKYDGKYNRKTKTWISNSDSKISIKMIKRANEDKAERALCELKGIITDKPFVGTCSLMGGGLF